MSVAPLLGSSRRDRRGELHRLREVGYTDAQIEVLLDAAVMVQKK